MSYTPRKANPWTKRNGDYKLHLNDVLKSGQDEYEILSELGHGAFGQVVKCLRKGSNQFVAIKILKNSPQFDYEVEQEKLILSIVMQETPDKFNFVRAIDSFEHRNHTCIIFDLLQEDLEHFLNNHVIPTKAVGYILHQLLTALVRLKELGIVHTDIKPQNIMLVDSKRFPYRVKLIDFGSAIETNNVAQGDYITTRYYRSPEVILGLPYNEKTDMWSLGCIAAELLIRHTLFQGSFERDQIQLICEMQGLPPNSMLENSHKTDMFFNRTADGFHLKPCEKEAIIENGMSKIKQLEDIASFNAPSEKGLEEISARNSITNLIKQMLQIDPEKRITAEEALCHEAVCDEYSLDESPRKP